MFPKNIEEQIDLLLGVRLVAIAGINHRAVNPFGTNVEYSSGSVSRRQDSVLSQHQDPSVLSTKKDKNDKKSITDWIENSEKFVRVRNTRFEFSVHEGTEKIMVKVIDEETNEIIREIPPEQILNMVAKMWELAGILVDERV